MTTATTTAADQRRQLAQHKLCKWFEQEGYELGWHEPIEDVLAVLFDNGFLSPHTVLAKTTDIEIEDDE